MKVLITLISLFFIVNTTLAQDHSENVLGPSESPQDVTAECLMCHEESGTEVLNSNHWNWLSSTLSAKFKPYKARAEK